MSQFNKEFTEITILRGMKFYQVVTEDSEKKSLSIFRAAEEELFLCCPEEDGCEPPRPH